MQSVNWDSIFAEIFDMRHDPIVAAVCASHDAAILLHTLNIKPGYIEWNAGLIEKISRQYYLKVAEAILENFKMFTFCPYETVTRSIDGESCVVPIVPQFGSWSVVTSPGPNGQTKKKVIDKVKNGKEYKIVESSRFTDGLNIYFPGLVKSQCGLFLKRFREYKEAVLQQKMEIRRYLNAKPYYQKITGKVSSQATDIAYKHMVESNLDTEETHIGLDSTEEIIEGKTGKCLPIGFEMASYQPEFQYKELFNLKEERREFMSELAMHFSEPLENLRSEKSGLGHSNMRYLEDSKNRKTAAVILEINDIVQALQTIWVDIYKRENPNISIEHGLILGIDDIIKLRTEEIIDPALSVKLAHEQIGIKVSRSSRSESDAKPAKKPREDSE